MRRGRELSPEDSQRGALGDPLAEVSAVDGVQAGRIRKIKPPHSSHDRGVRIVIRHVQVVGAVDQILQCLLAGYGFLGDASSPVAT